MVADLTVDERDPLPFQILNSAPSLKITVNTSSVTDFNHMDIFFLLIQIKEYSITSYPEHPGINSGKWFSKCSGWSLRSFIPEKIRSREVSYNDLRESRAEGSKVSL